MAREERTENALDAKRLTVVRTITGQIAADPTDLFDATFAPSAALDCRGFESILVGVEISGGTNPTCKLEPLLYDDGGVDGARWWRTQTGAISGVAPLVEPADQRTPFLQSGQLYELFVWGWSRVFLRVVAVGNETSTTALKIFAIPGRTRQATGRRWP